VGIVAGAAAVIGYSWPPYELLALGGALVMPPIPEKANMWSKERFSNITTKTWSTFGREGPGISLVTFHPGSTARN
jgi:hypothetical protein